MGLPNSTFRALGTGTDGTDEEIGLEYLGLVEETYLLEVFDVKGLYYL